MDIHERDRWGKLLKSIAFFAEFDGGEIDTLLEFCELRKFAAHSYIVKEHEKDNRFYVILKGQASVIKGDAMRGKHQLGSLAAGSCFGEMAVVLDEERSASVMAVDDVYLFRINGTQVEQLDPTTKGKLYKQFAKNLAVQLKQLSEKVSQ